MKRLRCVVIVIGVLLGGGNVLLAPGAVAQDDGGCSPLIADAVAQAGQSCMETARGEICYGYQSVTAVPVEGQTVTLAAGGDTAAVDAVQSLATAAVNPDEWGIARLMLPAGLPEEGGQAVTAILFGNSQISRPVQAQPTRPTLTVTNSGGSDVNLRGGAAITYDLVGTLGPGQSATADGRNEQGDWVRIQTENGMAWVFTPLITWEGDLNTLEVLLPGDVTPPFQAGEPFQAFTLTTGDSAAVCAAAGLLLQLSGETPATLQINQVGLEFSDATLLVTAAARDALEVRVLAGSATVTAQGIPQEAASGNMVRVKLGGEDGLTPTAPPSVEPTYAFLDAVNAPLSLLQQPVACLAGLPADQTASVVLRVGPGEQRGQLSNMQPDASYPVIGWANAPDNTPWWQLDTGTQKSWAAQSSVVTVGACDAVAQAEVPPLVFAPPSMPTPGGTPGEEVDDFAPDGNSVWQMYPGTDDMSGQCSGVPAINFCDHLAAISPAPGGIMWKGMEASPYYLTRIRPNVYAYSGPNILGTGTINITLTFTDATSLTMLESLTLSSEPSCRHVYHYTGTRNW